MADKKHIPPDVLARIGEQYIRFAETGAQMIAEDTPEAWKAHRDAAWALDKSYKARFKNSTSTEGEDLPKRFFVVEAGASYTIVAYDFDHAWLLFGHEIARTEMGEEIEATNVSLHELTEEEVARKHVTDDGGGRNGRYPLAEAEIGAVFSSEY
jgi:hypothetical protein